MSKKQQMSGSSFPTFLSLGTFKESAPFFSNSMQRVGRSGIMRPQEKSHDKQSGEPTDAGIASR